MTLNSLIIILVLVGVLFTLTLFLAIYLSKYFFSYLVFLLFMSGLIMMLMYFCSIVLNEKVLLFSDFFLIGLAGVVASLGSSGVSFCLNTLDYKLLYCDFVNLLKYMSYPYSIYSLFFISYLLFCLIVVYEVVKKCSGPLRMKT